MKKNTFISSLLFLLGCSFLPVEALSLPCDTNEMIDQFQDVDKDHPYCKEIYFAKSNKWVGGVGDNKFLPDSLLLRQEFAKIITLAAWRTEKNDLEDELIEAAEDDQCYRLKVGEKEVDIFGDIKGEYTREEREKLWYIEYICYAKKMEIMHGNESKSEPDKSYYAFPRNNISFLEALKMTMLAFGFEKDENKRCWQSEKAWFDDYLYSIVVNNIIGDFSVDNEESGNVTSYITRGYATYLIKSIYDHQSEINKCQKTPFEKSTLNNDLIKIRKSPSLKSDAFKIFDNNQEVFTIISDQIEGASVDGDSNWVMLEHEGRFGFVNINDNYYLELPFSGNEKISQGNHGSHSHKLQSWGDNIYAIDVAMYEEDVMAPTDGTIVRLYDETHNGTGTCSKGSECCLGGGRVLVMRDKDDNYFTFLHLKKDSFSVSVGDSVTQGDVLAKTGRSERVGGKCSETSDYHLHFHVWSGNEFPPDSHTTPFTANTPLRVGVGCKSNVEYLWGKKLDDSELKKISTCPGKISRRQFYSFNQKN
ncbi:MAG: M23 family metallopeptidase [Candidatus Electrothrix sp. MAN1_4]|nr:M23 family metallopeptidase [Candidatus Electrothrix sp. MAN1_4]